VRPELLCGLLAEPDRLRTYAALVLGARTPSEIAEHTGLSPKSVTAALRRLQQGGLVGVDDHRFVARTKVFKDAARPAAPPPAAEEPLDPDRHKAAVLRAFIADGRLLQMPAAWAKRRIVLEHIAAVFEPGVKYPEKDVNAILRAWYPDYAALRRYLVDEELLDRDNGLYWRVGGPVDVADHARSTG
jgi:hypothetical protein